MYKRKLRNTASRQSRGGANLYAIDDLEAATMELENMDEFNQIIFERDEYFRVKSTDVSKCKPGDIVIRVGGIEVFDIQGGANALHTLVESQAKWPLTVELRLGSKLAATTKQQPVVSTRSMFLPQIPHAVSSSNSSSSSNGVLISTTETEIDLTLEDEGEDDDKVQVVDGPNGTTAAQIWSKGQIVRTIYGVGSVVDSTNDKLTVMLHWNGLSELYNNNSSKNVSHPIAYLNTSSPVTDCAQEVVMLRGDFTLNRAEFARFQSGMYLNDTIIDLFLHHLVYEKLPWELSQRCHVMTTHFFSQLDQQRFNQVASWTKNVDIFAKDFVLIPVNEANHWSLAILCFLNRLIVNNKKPASSTPNNDVKNGMKEGEEEVIMCNVEDDSTPAKKKNQTSKKKDQLQKDDDEEEEQNGNNKRRRASSSSGAGGGGKKGGGGRISSELNALMASNNDDVDNSDFEEEEGGRIILKTPAKEEVQIKSSSNSSSRSKRTVKRTKRLVDEMMEEEAQEKQRKQQQEQQQQKRRQSMTMNKQTSSSSSSADNNNSMIVEDEVDDTPEMPMILKLDSTKSHESKDVAKNLRMWIQQEYARRKKSNVDDADLIVDSKTLPIVPPKVPLQSNSCDCGVFVVVFAEKFLNDQKQASSNPLKATVKQVKRRLGKQFGSEWFPLSDIQKKRMEMAQLVQQWGNVKL